MASESAKVNSQSSDVGAIWEAAVRKYREKTKTELLISSTWSVSSIMKEQERQLQTFSQYRHDASKLDKLRSFLSRNCEIVQSLAEQVATAASSSFPPSTVILTAFTHLITTSRNVSADYDIIVSFFDIINNFLERLSLLESRLPPSNSFRVGIIHIFSSILVMCGIAREYQSKGRLIKWAKALYIGQDPNLKEEFENLQSHIQALESLTISATLATTIDLSRDVSKMTEMQGRSLSLLESNHSLILENTQSLDRFMKGMGAGLKSLRQGIMQHDVSVPDRNGTSIADSGAKRFRELNDLRRELDAGGEYRNANNKIWTELHQSHVKGTFDWIRNETSYHDFVDEKCSLLCIHGSPGIGKSTVAYTTRLSLPDDCDTFGSATPTYVAHYFSGQDRGSFERIMGACAMQIADIDPGYRRELLPDVRGQKHPDDVFQVYFRSKFGSTSNRRLILILDLKADDKTVEERVLREVLENIEQKCRIQMVVTTITPPEGSLLTARHVHLTKEVVLQDMRKAASATCASLPRLHNLRAAAIRRIEQKVVEKADSFYFIKHTLYRLNTIGREEPITRALSQLPENTDQLYHLLIQDCEKHRSEDDLRALKKLFAWLAFVDTTHSVLLLSGLLENLSSGGSIDLDVELNWRLSLLLRIYRDNRDPWQNERKEAVSEPDGGDNEFDKVWTDQDSIYLNVCFHERNLRAFLSRQDEIRSGDEGILCTESSGRLLVLEMMVEVLTNRQFSVKTDWVRESLIIIARSWKTQILNIDVGKLSDKEFGRFLTCLYTILSNTNGCIMKLESQALQSVTEEETMPPWILDDDDDILKLFPKLAARGASVNIDQTILRWLQNNAQEPKDIFLSLAQCHADNWFKASGKADSFIALRFTAKALITSRKISAHGDDVVLWDCLNMYNRSSDVTEELIMAIGKFYQTSSDRCDGYSAMALALEVNGCWKSALQVLEHALADVSTEWSHFRVLVRTGEVLVKLAKDSTDNDATVNFLARACHTLEKTLQLQPLASHTTDEQAALVAVAYGNLAYCFLLQGLPEKFISVIQVLEDRQLNEHYGTFLGHDILQTLTITERWSLLVDYVKLCPKLRITSWLFDWAADIESFTISEDYQCLFASNSDSGAAELSSFHDMFQRAGFESNNADFVIETYQTVRRSAPMISDTHLGKQLAHFYSNVLGKPEDLVKAKEILNRFVDDPQGIFYIVGASENALCIADILLEQFRGTIDPAVKVRVLAELRDLVYRISSAMGAGFDPSQSQIVIPLAHALQKLGPTMDFNMHLQSTFDGCIAALNDFEGWNDAASLRMLAKVLSFIPSLRREAQVAATCQLYVLDLSLYEQQLRKKNAKANFGEDRGESEFGSESPGSESSDVAYTMKCADCGVERTDWTGSSMYLCYYCSDLDLCESCHSKKVLRDRGELPPRWKRVCAKGHDYIKAPVNGWGGVHDNALIIDGITTPFKDWLAALEASWKEAWTEFWSEQTRSDMVTTKLFNASGS